MAFDALDPVSAIWRGFGLTWLLVPEELRVKPRARPAQARGTREPARPAAPPKHQQSGPASPPRDQQPGPAAPPKYLQVEWPDAWSEQLEAARKGRIAWTYPDLGPDLLAARAGAPADAARTRRGALLRRIVKDLGHPPGTHTFWPMRLESELRPDLFLAGCLKLNVRGIFIFGPESASQITGQASLSNYSLRRLGRWSVWCLPEIDSIDGGIYAKMLAYIRNSLAATFPV